MIYARPNTPFDALTNAGPAASGLVGVLGVRVIDNDGNIIAARQTSGIAELVAGSGIYRARFAGIDADELHGTVVWDGGGFYGSEDLTVSADAPTVPTSGYVPSIEEVAKLVRARTKARGSGGREVGTFDDTTRPTGDDVTGLILNAVDEVLGKVQEPEAGTAYERRVRGAIALYTAMLVELSFYPEQVERGQSPYASYEKLYESRIKALIAEGETGEVQGEGDGEGGGGSADASWWFPEDAGGLIGWSSHW